MLTEIQVRPSPTQVMNPSALTVATPELPLMHFRIFFFFGRQLGNEVVICAVSPTLALLMDLGSTPKGPSRGNSSSKVGNGPAVVAALAGYLTRRPSA